MLRRLTLALLFLLTVAPAFASPPPAVPGLPDTERRTSYSISTSTCACSIGFALYADGTDIDQWIQVWINGVRKLSTDSTYGWSITSPTGPLSTIPRPITDGVLTFNTAQTATVQIVGARRPRRTSQFTENRGVAARDLNQVLTDIISQNREMWDKINDVTGRALISQPGNTLGPLPLPSACVSQLLGFDNTGLNPVCLPISTVAGFLPTNTPNTVLQYNGGGALAALASLPSGFNIPAPNITGSPAWNFNGTPFLIGPGNSGQNTPFGTTYALSQNWDDTVGVPTNAGIQALTSDVFNSDANQPFGPANAAVSRLISDQKHCYISGLCAPSFNGQISGTTLTVNSVSSGSIFLGMTVTGTGVTGGTTISSYGTGNGLTGTYTVNNSQSVSAEAMTGSGYTLAAGEVDPLYVVGKQGVKGDMAGVLVGVYKDKGSGSDQGGVIGFEADSQWLNTSGAATQDIHIEAAFEESTGGWSGTEGYGYLGEAFLNTGFAGLGISTLDVNSSTFTGQITTTTLTVTCPCTGTILPGTTITGVGVTGSTTISSYGTGTGGAGTYTVNNSQSVGSEAMSGSNTHGWKYVVAATQNRATGSQYFSIAGDTPDSASKHAGDITIGVGTNAMTIDVDSSGNLNFLTNSFGNIIQFTQAGAIKVAGSSTGVTCGPGTPSASWATVNGITTHC